MDPIKVKTFYSYNIKENATILKIMGLAINIVIALIPVGLIIGLIVGSPLYIGLYLVIGTLPAIVVLPKFIPGRKQLKAIFDNESVTTMDDAIEFTSPEGTEHVTWAAINDVKTSDFNILFIKQKKYTVNYTVKNSRKRSANSLLASVQEPTNIEKSFSFYSSIENVDFLINSIDRNRKKVIESQVNTIFTPIKKI